MHSFPRQILLAGLEDVVKALVKGPAAIHTFKMRVGHIFERIGRRLGWETLESAVGTADEEGVKILRAARKRKERAKKKKSQKEAEEAEAGSDAGAQGGARHDGDTFEDVLYGDDSDKEDGSGAEVSDDEPQTKKGKKQKRSNAPQLRMDDDEPMDLLQGAGGHVGSKS